MRDASFTTRWVAEASIRLMCGKSDVKIRQTSSWDEERQDILERARWLCSKIIVSPRKLLDQMPKELGEEFGGQWAIYSCSMLMFALGNISKLYPDQKDACIKKMEELLPIVMSEEIRNSCCKVPTYSNLPITRMLNFTQQLLLLSTHCMFPEKC